MIMISQTVKMKIKLLIWKNMEKYGACPGCLAWINLRSVKRHVKKCPASTGTYLSSQSKGTLILQSNVICGRIPSSAFQALIKEVFPIMKNEDTENVAKQDRLIINLGYQWMLRNKGNEIMRKYYTSSVMRLAARLLLALRHLDKSQKSLDEFLKPGNFELVVKAALRCCIPKIS
ncbi:unnamed protein product [Mytilus edulis]|uniref:Uncharacterized protein n=1 Tax=Mytilus edulis TaxID=6550 RepID=A0A8S3VP34_MYTED|nr:unnamed protein product [Mytilus edulis]